MNNPDWVKTAKAGDFVVCIEGVAKTLHGASPLVKGKVYVIKNTFISSAHYSDAGRLGVRLNHHNNGSTPFGETGWSPRLFRPVKPLPISLTEHLKEDA